LYRINPRQTYSNIREMAYRAHVSSEALAMSLGSTRSLEVAILERLAANPVNDHVITCNNQTCAYSHLDQAFAASILTASSSEIRRLWYAFIISPLSASGMGARYSSLVNDKSF
jgi:hypothetical protein